MATALIEELKHDHQQVLGTLEQMMETTQRAERKRQDLLRKLNSQLKPHMKAEEKVFYPALRDGASDKVLEALEEHHLTETLLRELNRLSTDDERWGAKVKVLRELVGHHVKEEEQEVLPRAEETLDGETMKKLLDRFHAVKATEQKKLS